MEEAKNSSFEDEPPSQLQAEVDHLRQHLAERDGHIVALEAEFLKCTAQVNDLHDQVDTWREKYERLYDSHKRVQKLNQVLEDKLLQMVDKMKGEKNQLTKDIATLSVRLAESKHNCSMLQKENARYKNDMNLAIQLLQCKPDHFVSHKLDNLPVDTQARVSQYVMSKTSKSSSGNSKNGNEVETFDASEYDFNISASLMTKILEDSIQDSVTKHCDTCTCSKSQTKPFCYNETYYSVSTQTQLSGEMKNSLCLSCNSEIKSVSNVSLRGESPFEVKVINEKHSNIGLTGPLYIIPHLSDNSKEPTNVDNDKIAALGTNNLSNDKAIKDELNKNESPKESLPEPKEDIKIHGNNSSTLNMVPSVHHKLCDRTIPSMSSKVSSHSVGHEELLKNVKDTKAISEGGDNIISHRKNSQSSMGAISRTSSVAKSAKSTVSTHKSNTTVGPGPRFCHLRMQAGSKNILLDNAEPDVPPVLYRRQSKCNENSLFKDMNEGLDNFIDLNKPVDESLDTKDIKPDNVVVESTLIDVHVENNKETNNTAQVAPINPVLMNVSSSPLQPLKTHNFGNESEIIPQSVTSQIISDLVDDLLNDFSTDNTKNNNQDNVDSPKTEDVLTPPENDIKIFNFDQYEQNKLAGHIRPLRTIGMTQLNSIANTRISKDFPVTLPKINKPDSSKNTGTLPAVNVYPNLTQTHLKVNENKEVFTNEQSSSSLSSDDSAALLQKQQLLRVAEWVEKNLELQNNYNDPLEDEVNFSTRAQRDSKLSRLTETLNELALNMPHPVSKYSKLYRDGHNNWVHNGTKKDKARTSRVTNITKETVFPVESEDATFTETGNEKLDNAQANEVKFDLDKEIRDVFQANGDKDISPEDLARMEYNVKKFLLSGPHWVNTDSAGRSRRTSSKTETDV